MNIDILVNGSPVAKYYDKTGKCFVQANEGSEYEIKIHNNNWYRVLAVVSVDGLSVLTGKTASTEDAGYVINGYSSYKIKGYRYDNSSVGAFKFTGKNESYSATKGKNAKKNCGVIGICIYKEKSKEHVSEPVRWFFNPLSNPWDTTIHPYIPRPQVKKYVLGDFPEDVSEPYTTTTTFTCNTDNIEKCSSNIRSMNMHSGCIRGGQSVNSVSNYSCDFMPTIYSSPVEKKSLVNFTMGTTWGNSKESKVVEAEFEKDYMVFSLDIYYATREELVRNGIIEENKPKVSFPKSFPKKYASPPPGWVGE